jgi:hypothetical protein
MWLILYCSIHNYIVGCMSLELQVKFIFPVTSVFIRLRQEVGVVCHVWTALCEVMEAAKFLSDSYKCCL